MVEQSAARDVLYGDDNYQKIMHPAETGAHAAALTDREELLKTVIHRLRDAHRQQNAELTACRLELQRVSGELAEQREAKRRQEGEQRTRSEEELRVVREEVRKRVEEQTAETQRFSELLELRSRELDDKDREFQGLELKLAEAEKQGRAKDRTIDELQKELEDARLMLGDTRGELHKHIDTVRIHADEISELYVKVSSGERQLQEAAEELKRARKDTEDAKARVTDLEKLNAQTHAALEQTKIECQHDKQKAQQDLREMEYRLEESTLQSERLGGDAEMRDRTLRDMLDELRDKDEVIFKTNAVVVDQQHREQDLHDELRRLMKVLRQRTDELRRVDDVLLSQTDRIATRGIGEPFGAADPRNLLVQCAPVGVPVVKGREVKLYITTLNSAGLPVRGEEAGAFSVRIHGANVGSPEICVPASAKTEGSPRRGGSSARNARPGSPRGRPSSPGGGSRRRNPSPRGSGSPSRRSGSPRVSATAAEGSARADSPQRTFPPLVESSTFVKSLYASQEGWTPVTVTYRGHAVSTGFFCFESEEEARREIDVKWDACRDEDAEVRRDRELALLAQARALSGSTTLTVSCSPAQAHPGDTVDVSVVVRDKEGRPLVGGPDLCTEISANAMFSSVPSGAAGYLGPLKRAESSGVYTASLRVPEGVSDYAGVVASLGQATAGGCCSLSQTARRPVHHKTTVCCFPDPATLGETVTAVITTRGNDFGEASLEDAQSVLFNVRPTGGASKVSHVQPLGSDGDASQWGCTFIAGKPGRGGLEVDYGGKHLGDGSVEVLVGDTYDPASTVVTISPDSVAPGQKARATIRTQDRSGHLAAGPPPSQILVRKLGATREMREVPSRGAVDGEYTVDFAPAEDARAGDRAGVAVEIHGATVACEVPVSSTQGEETDAVIAAPPINAAFLRDPISCGETADLVIQVAPGDAPPTIHGVANVEGIEGPRQEAHSPAGLYLATVTIGKQTGTASVLVSSSASRLQVSTTVLDSPVSELDTEIARLRRVQLKLKQCGMQSAPAAPPKPASPPRRAGSPRAAPSPSPKQARRAAPEVKVHPRFGLELTGGLRARAGQMAVGAGERLGGDKAGAEVAEVKAGPCEGKIQAGDHITGLKAEGAAAWFPVQDKKDFDDFRKTLGTIKQGEKFGIVAVKLNRDEQETQVEVQPANSESEVRGSRVRRGVQRIDYETGTSRRTTTSSRSGQRAGSRSGSPGRRSPASGRGPMDQASFDRQRNRARAAARQYQGM